MFVGLYFVRFEAKVQKRDNLNQNIDRFKAFFGVEPTTVDPIVHDLTKEYHIIGFKYARMTLIWYYLYENVEIVPIFDYCRHNIYVGRSYIRV